MAWFKKSGQSTKRFTRVFFATDVHGSTDCFVKFLNAATEYSCECLILGGDISGKMVVPVIERDNGTWDSVFLGNKHVLNDEAGVRKLEEHISRSGSYPYRMTSSESQTLQASGERERKIEEIAVGLMEQRLQEWVKLAEERLSGSGVKLFMGAGNDDPFTLDPILNSSAAIEVYDGHVVRVDEHHELVGLGFANITPWSCPRDVDEEVLAQKLDDCVAGLEDVANAILCIHVPPKDSRLDTCLKLDGTVYPPKVMLDSRGQPMEHGAGSSAVDEAIRKYQPMVGLHGHIHESRGRVMLGKTECYNPGSEYAEGILRGVILNIDENRVVSYQFTSG